MTNRVFSFLTCFFLLYFGLISHRTSFLFSASVLIPTYSVFLASFLLLFFFVLCVVCVRVVLIAVYSVYTTSKPPPMPLFDNDDNKVNGSINKGDDMCIWRVYICVSG